MFGRAATVAWSMSIALVSACGSSTPAEPSVSGEAVAPLGALNVLTRAYDNQRSGTNLAESVLNSQNVNPSQFGLLFRSRVDDELYASLLYASGVNIDGAPHNVLYAGTVSNTLYAIDADDGTRLWSRSYNGSGRPARIQDTNELEGCFNVTNNTGITGTPVIDAASQTLYFAAHTLTDGKQRYELHAVDIRTGAEKFGGPVAINADGFDPVFNNQRTALALSGGVVYVAFASYCDRGTYHGWVMGYDATTLARTAAINVTRDGRDGGIWQAGAGPAFDADGNLYISTGNGSFDGNKQFGMTLLKLAPRTLDRIDYFTPSNYADANDRDLDLGSAGPSLVPGQNLIVTGAKDGYVYVLNRDNLGHRADGDTQIPQRLTAVSTAPHPSGTHHIHNGVVLWKSPSGTNMYVWGENDYLRAYRFNETSGKFDTRAVAVGSVLPPEGMPGGMMALSANGSQAGTGILWATTQAVGDANNFTVPGTLSAFDASSLKLLWQSSSAGNDMLSLAKFNAPLVANGKVYVPSFSNTISVYGLRNGPPPPIQNATYQLRLGTAEGLCVDVDGGSTADAALVQQYSCNGTAAQRWNVRNVTDNVYEVVSEASGKCLDVEGASNANGARVQQYTCNGTAAQRWAIDDLGGGAYRLISQSGGKCLDVPGGSTNLATKLQQYSCNGTAAQTLIFALDNRGEAPIPGGTFRIRTGTRTGQCLDAKLVLGNLGELRQLSCNDSAGQRFRFRRLGTDDYEIRPAISERCLDVDGGSAADAANVQQYLCNGSSAQRWKARALGGGQYQLLAQTGSERCLDVEGGSGADFTPLQQYACNGTPAQSFSVIAP